MTPFSDDQRDIVMATNFRVKLAKSDYAPLFVAMAF